MIEIRSVSKKFGKFAAVDQVSLTIPKKGFFVLLGPSGCGKTTLLRLVAGFFDPDEGEIFIDGKNVVGLPPYKRPVNTVFQSYALFPHMTVFDNVAYGLRIAKEKKRVISTKVFQALETVDLNGLAKTKPERLSGGQKQRVALARALVMKPSVLLLDEPLSALDAKLREQMRNRLVALQRQVGITFAMVTHDQQEALSMADRVAVMNQGKLVQVGTPETIYHAPSNAFVANFIGKINWLESLVLKKDDAGWEVEIFQIGKGIMPPSFFPSSKDAEKPFPWGFGPSGCACWNGTRLRRKPGSVFLAGSRRSFFSDRPVT